MAETLLLYADSGGGKTSQIVQFSKYIYETTGKKTRVVTWDGGGAKPIEDSGLIELGIIQILYALNFDYALAALKKVTRGEWLYKVKQTDGTIMVKLAPTSQKQMDEIGAYAFEGLSSTSDKLLSHISEQNEKVIFQNAHYEEDGESFGTPDKGHYNIVQKEMYNAVMKSKGLPVSYVMWTAHVAKGEDRGKETVYGPQVAGSAKTTIAPGWFGSCLHIQTYEDFSTTEEGQSKVEVSRFAYYLPHPDPVTGVKYLCKPRCAPSEWDSLLEELPGGYVTLTPEVGIEQYFYALDKMKVNAGAKMGEWKKKIDEERK